MGLEFPVRSEKGRKKKLRASKMLMVMTDDYHTDILLQTKDISYSCLTENPESKSKLVPMKTIPRVNRNNTLEHCAANKKLLTLNCINTDHSGQAVVECGIHFCPHLINVLKKDRKCAELPVILYRH